MEALQKLDAILNNEPEQDPTTTATGPMQRRITFDKAANKPAETEPSKLTITPRVIEQPQMTRTKPIHKATIDKSIPKTPTPRVPSTKSTKEITPARIKMREQIRKHIKAKRMTRILQRKTYLRQTTRTHEQAQLIHDKETNTYLNYRQLL